jgi:hypothetical protein
MYASVRAMRRSTHSRAGIFSSRWGASSSTATSSNTAVTASALLALLLMCRSVAGAAEGNPSHLTRIRLELDGTRAPILVATVDGMPVRLRFDLGDATSLVLQKTVLDKVHATPTGKFHGQAVEGRYEAPLFRVARIEIGGTLFKDAIARQDQPRKGYVPSRETSGFMGTGLLKSFAVVIDYPARTMMLVPKEEAARLEQCQGTEIPFTDTAKWRGEPVTEAMTDIGPVIMWWDTGAPFSVLRKERMEQAGDRKTLETAHLVLGSRDFGPWRFELWGQMNLPGFDGFIGYDFFAKHVVCVDFPDNRVIVPTAEVSTSATPSSH